MNYNFREKEQEWQKVWEENQVFAARNDSEKPKYYVLDMFPYPSGAGLHVGHPLGYIASDIYSRYKRQKGFNVLHPMGYDSFGLPAEQYAIQTGQHPAKTTKENIATYRRQMDAIGFSFDWSREVRTSDPEYYRWTQWIFMQLFNAWYCKNADTARPIDRLIEEFTKHGNVDVNAHCDETPVFSADEWKGWNETEQQKILLNYRLTYLSETMVNWCPGLGTVLANDEVKDGVSERGGFPVERRKMQQWSMRISAYAQRLLDGLADIDWSDSLKEMQRNWIGRSEGASVSFEVLGQRDENSGTPSPSGDSLPNDRDRLFSGGELAVGAINGEQPETRNSQLEIDVFTTRPDTIFGVTFMTLAPEHELVDVLTTEEQREAVAEYVSQSKKRSERDRMADVKTVSGVFTGAYVKHPFTGNSIPIWIGDYVLAGYGTGAVMAVPSGDQRDHNFATHFNIPIIPVIEGTDISQGANEDKGGILINSDFLNGMKVKDAIRTAIEHLERKGCGNGEINYRLRDAIFSRQRYWGEPIPAYFKNGVPYLVDEKDLPLRLPEVDKYLPTEDGEPPLARAENWTYSPEGSDENYPLEASTMPGWAGSSWYFLRYMDPHNANEFVAKDVADSWGQVDLYLGGAEHATGHLLYVRFWTKFLFDLGHISIEEPAKKLINQGMIQGMSAKLVADGIRIDGQDNGRTKSNSFMISGAGQQVGFGDFTVVQGVYSADLPDGKIDPNNPNKFKYDKRVPLEYVNPDNSLDVPRYVASYHGKEFFESAFFTTKGYWYKGNFLEYRPENGAIPNNYIRGDTFNESEATEKFYLTRETEKMSKSKYNVVNPDVLIEKYGADTLRMYEMFLGPIQEAKPWNTNGIEGVSKFLKRYWRLFIVNEKFAPTNEKPTAKELKALHATLKKVGEDIEKFAFNTCVSQFMICLNELSTLKCNKRQILEPLTLALSPFAPHMCEEIWKQLGHSTSISGVEFPMYDESFLVEDSISYPISFNGKTRLSIELGANLSKDEVEKLVLENAEVQERLEGNPPRKVIVVPGRIVNIVV